MTNIPLIEQDHKWRPLPLIVLQLFALALLASWWFEGSAIRLLWDNLDKSVFYWLNGSLKSGELWQRFWAVANVRLFDLVPALLFLFLSVHFAFAGQRKHLVSRSALLLFLLLYMIILIDLADTLIGLKRNSPSLMLQPAYLLSELVPGTTAKDNSGFSFPGDHATVLFFLTGFLWYFGNRRYGIIALAAAILFAMPRLVGGAHWLTDTVVGGLTIAMIGLAWLFFSPLPKYGIKILLPITRPLVTALEWLLEKLGFTRPNGA